MMTSKIFLADIASAGTPRYSNLIHALESPERLSKRATATLTNPENGLELSSISLVEIAIKAGLVETLRRRYAASD